MTTQAAPTDVVFEWTPPEGQQKFDLEAPYSRSGYRIADGARPVMQGPLLVRSRTSTRWHRVRSAIKHKMGHISWHLWCGQAQSDTNSISRDTLPTDGLPVCGACEGKALGAGYNGTAAILAGETQLLFSPRSKNLKRPPTTCPGHRDGSMWQPIDGTHSSVGLCLACRLVVAIKTCGTGRGYTYQAWDAPVAHAPGEHLVEPCLFHGWDDLIVTATGVICSCARTADTPVVQRQHTPAAMPATLRDLAFNPDSDDELDVPVIPRDPQDWR